MCAAGLPAENENHAFEAVSAALEIRDFIVNENEKRRKIGKVFFDIRVGIHSEAVVAGIVGIKKFAYDIWGDTVNTASRMEHGSETNKVNISGATYELVKDFFDCEYRGKIEVKGKGEIDMYFVEYKF
ncbi:MAG: adenylate/guanylate cyclase domain-containing protein, partial [Bacteroidetes bacterium]|nr:adenylate/guanylate cyclase domain-containing protein [Bacteroidota bacterium]